MMTFSKLSSEYSTGDTLVLLNNEPSTIAWFGSSFKKPTKTSFPISGKKCTPNSSPACMVNTRAQTPSSSALMIGNFTCILCSSFGSPSKAETTPICNPLMAGNIPDAGN